LCGQEGYFGTNSFQVLLNINKLQDLPLAPQEEETNVEKIIEENLIINHDDPCSIQNLTITSDTHNIEGTSLGNNDYEMDF